MTNEEYNLMEQSNKKGWIKLHRCLTNKAIWKCSTPEQKVILITLLIMANHKENEWEWNGNKYITQPGQFITSLKSIAYEAGSGISIKNVRTALEKFEKFEFLTNKSTNKNRLITIVNWDLYQSVNEELASKLAGNRQATGKQSATNKNDKELKEEISLKKESKVFTRDDKPYLLAVLLSNAIAERLDKPLRDEKTLQSWAKEFDKMVRLDGYNTEEMIRVLEFSQGDNFWKKNILSASKFRKQYITLLAQVKG